MTARSKLPVGVLGYGRFGRAFAQLLRESGREVVAYDPVTEVPADIRAETVEDLANRTHDIILAVPVPALRRALEVLRPHLTERHLAIDVSSVKHGPVKNLTDVLGARIPWVATHPLFGPTSILRGERPLRAVVCPNALHPEAAARAGELFKSLGCRVVEQDADAHDQIMAQTHALAFFVAKGLLEAGVGEGVPFAPPSFQALKQVIESVRADAGHLFVPIESQNPYAAEAREKLMDAFSKIHHQLADVTAASADMGIPTVMEPTPELLKNRGLIDELDEELVALLARRAQLARRVGAEKEKKGKAVQDPGREKEVLSKRGDWAKDLGLGVEGISDVFQAVMRFSRAEQRRAMKKPKKS